MSERLMQRVEHLEKVTMSDDWLPGACVVIASTWMRVREFCKIARQRSNGSWFDPAIRPLKSGRVSVEWGRNDRNFLLSFNDGHLIHASVNKVGSTWSKSAVFDKVEALAELEKFLHCS